LVSSIVKVPWFDGTLKVLKIGDVDLENDSGPNRVSVTVSAGNAGDGQTVLPRTATKNASAKTDRVRNFMEGPPWDSCCDVNGDG